ncbi:hypothetical protein GE061_002262 [Apolygus lucorum]|uniref:Uncharacterized protein n=1 Tax=Apolygus lucorum TaxID=248454 RepID=A0A8S9X605_APOLU|nr:hypothetical protein GE061_002262 [Apolygus lucorum]
MYVFECHAACGERSGRLFLWFFNASRHDLCYQCLKDVVLIVPSAVRAGTTLHLACHYDLEGALLYSVKFYQGDQEFYRFVPKESPPTRVFPLPDIQVDLSDPGKDGLPKLYKAREKSFVVEQPQMLSGLMGLDLLPSN